MNEQTVKNIWLQTLKDLNQMNASIERSLGYWRGLSEFVSWYVANGGNFNMDVFYNLKRRIESIKKKSSAINYCVELLKDKKAMISYPSSKTGYGFDIVTTLDPKSEDFKRANVSSLGVVAIVPFIPIIIKAGAVVGTAAIALGITNVISDTIIDSKKIENEIVKQQQQHEQLLMQNPELFKLWLGHKDNLVKSGKLSIGDWFSKVAQGAAGNIISVVLIALAGYFVFKMLDKKNDT